MLFWWGRNTDLQSSEGACLYFPFVLGGFGLSQPLLQTRGAVHTPPLREWELPNSLSVGSLRIPSFLCLQSDLSRLSEIDKSLAVFCMATYGEGDPTDNAQDFYDWLQEADADLSGLRFAVSALPDFVLHLGRKAKSPPVCLGERPNTVSVPRCTLSGMRSLLPSCPGFVDACQCTSGGFKCKCQSSLSTP